MSRDQWRSFGKNETWMRYGVDSVSMVLRTFCVCNYEEWERRDIGDKILFAAEYAEVAEKISLFFVSAFSARSAVKHQSSHFSVSEYFLTT